MLRCAFPGTGAGGGFAGQITRPALAYVGVPVCALMCSMVLKWELGGCSTGSTQTWDVLQTGGGGSQAMCWHGPHKSLFARRLWSITPGVGLTLVVSSGLAARLVTRWYVGDGVET